MLDYSDEELEARSIRRRTYSPFREPEGLSSSKNVVGGIENEAPVAFKLKKQSVFQSFKGRGSGIIMPTNDAFIISEFVPPRARQSKLQDTKGEVALFKPTTFGPFSSGSKDHPDSFFQSMKTIVIVAQFFGVLPVSGTLGRVNKLHDDTVTKCARNFKNSHLTAHGTNFENISFKWIHYKTVYWAMTFLGTVFCFVCSTVQGLDKGEFTHTASKIIYFACGVLSSLLMLNLSQNWKNVNKEFAEVEFKLKRYGYPKRMSLKFRVFTILVLAVALVEHLLAKLKNLELATVCARRKDDFFSLAEFFFVNEYPEVYSLFSYSFWNALLVFTAHFLVTANWNIKDMFLCLISWNIAERFKQVHDSLDNIHGQEKPMSFWKEAREDYNNLSVLTKRVDTRIQKLMLLSIGNNLFFICIQLLHSLKRKITSFKMSIYFFWSFGFLVLRTSFVAFSAARINDESKEPKTVLYSVPQKNYSAEVRRFLTQMTTNDVALTGSGFFSVTRSLILTIIGTVITYEIVLVQFSGNETEEDLKNNNTMCLQY